MPVGILNAEKKDSLAQLKYKECTGHKPHGNTPGSTVEEMLKTALSSSSCDGLMKLILETENEKNILYGTRGFSQMALEHISSQAEMLKGHYQNDNQENPLEKKMKIIGQFGDYLKEKCPDLQKENTACNSRSIFAAKMESLKKKIADVIAAEETEEKEAEYRNSPEGLVDQACACDKFIALYQQQIDRQKEIGKVSGTVNMATLNDAGTNIVDIRKIKNDLAIRYKAMKKKDLSRYACQKTDELTNPLLWARGTPIRQKE